jgi:hypothetical protein
MARNIPEYLTQLKTLLEGRDRALIQDALSASEEHLHLALERSAKEQPELPREEALKGIVAKYGTPSEVAAVYLDFEARQHPPKKPAAASQPRPFWAGFIGIFAEPRAWGAFLYLVISVLTGLIYTGWIIIGGIFSLTSLIFIIGIPISAAFLLSLRGLGLLEGRIVEALLGERMPLKPLFVQQGLSWKAKFKALFTEPLTWKIFVYLLLQFPLGLFYFFVSGGLFVLALSFISAPILELIFHLPLELLGDETFTPVWLLPLVWAAGILMVPLILHVTKVFAKFHRRYAKAMLVRK